MCGIAGVWHPVGDLGASIHAMTERIRHRGPDADGHHLFTDAGLALGHRRLAIVDLTPTGAQPMFSASNRYGIVFNGEIYNFRSLRLELEQAGHRFRGSSDTEVMLAAFEEYGIPEALSRFAGMFAFAVWDAAEECLWLARDRMGEKPLYFGQFGRTFAFASELKSLRTLPNCPRQIDQRAVSDVLERGYIRGTRSIHVGVSKVLPGSYVKVTRSDGAIQLDAGIYWSVEQSLGSTSNVAHSESAGGDREAIDNLDALLQTVVGDEMLADVGVGAFLSGGIDSSLLVAVMQHISSIPVRTFTIGFDEKAFDESAFALDVATHLRTQHTEIRLQASDALGYIAQLPDIFDEPFADSSQIPTLLVCQATRQHVTVALSGDGGDELFGGYSQYQSRDTIGRIVSSVPLALRGTAASLVGALPDRVIRMLSQGATWSPNAKARVTSLLTDSTDRQCYETLLSSWVEPSMVLASHQPTREQHESRLAVAWPRARSLQEARMAYDMQTYLPDDILVKVDRSAMAFSLETRAPLLDHRIVEFALSQPLHRKIRNGTGKFLLRRLLGRYVPTEMWNRPKRGFATPLASWLRGDLREWAEAQLAPDHLFMDLFNPQSVRAVWDAHLEGADHSARLWRILMVMQWVRAQA